MDPAISNFYQFIPMLRQCHSQIFMPVGAIEPIEKKSKWKKWPKTCRFGTLFLRDFILTPLELETQKLSCREFNGCMRDHMWDFVISCFVYDSHASKVSRFRKNEKKREKRRFVFTLKSIIKKLSQILKKCKYQPLFMSLQF